VVKAFAARLSERQLQLLDQEIDDFFAVRSVDDNQFDWLVTVIMGQ